MIFVSVHIISLYLYDMMNGGRVFYEDVLFIFLEGGGMGRTPGEILNLNSNKC